MAGTTPCLCYSFSFLSNVCWLSSHTWLGSLSKIRCRHTAQAFPVGLFPIVFLFHHFSVNNYTSDIGYTDWHYKFLILYVVRLCLKDSKCYTFLHFLKLCNSLTNNNEWLLLWLFLKVHQWLIGSWGIHNRINEYFLADVKEMQTIAFMTAIIWKTNR